MKQQSQHDAWFGTDGIRTRVGNPPLTREFLPNLGYTIGQWVIKQYGLHTPILLGHDTRISCSFMKSALLSGLLLHPLTIYDAHILPTPAICKLIKESDDFKTGIVITASHNLYQDNGIKIIDATGTKSKEVSSDIEQLYASESHRTSSYSNLGTVINYENAVDQYISHACIHFSPYLLSGIKIVLDCANGVFSSIAPEIFELLGADVTAINNNPNGTNINQNCGVLHTDGLITALNNVHADIGFAFDGDGDRLVVITKESIQKDGDDILALLLHHPDYKHASSIVGTIMSNEGFSRWLSDRDKNLIRADVGEPSIIEVLKQNNLILGGEPSGHIVLSDYLDSSDALFTALRLLETAIMTNNWSLKSFDHYPQVNLTVPVSKKLPLDMPPLASIITDGHNKLIHGRLIVRYSGTESLLRITAEDYDEKHAKQVAYAIAEQCKQKLC